MTPTEYRAVKAINATAIKAGRKSMLHMHHALTKGKDATPAMRWGSLLHGQLLQPDEKPVVLWPGRRAGKEWEAFKAANDGAEILIQSEYDKLMGERAEQLNAVQMIRTHPEASAELAGCSFESALKWDEPGIGPCKALLDAWKPGPDAWTPGVVIDIKCSREIDERAFWSSSWHAGTHLQLAWYMRGLRANGHDVSRAVIIAQESAPPFDVAVFDADPPLLAYGEKECLRIARDYRMAEKRGYFPGAHVNRRQLIQPAYADEEVQGVDFEGLPEGELDD